MLRIVLLLAFVAFVLGTRMTWLVRRAGRRARLLDSHGTKGHSKTELRLVPNIGGIAIFWSIALPMGAAMALAWLDGNVVERFAFLSPASIHLEGVRDQTPMGVGLLACLAALHVLGLVDDRRAVRAWVKLLVMVGVAAVMVIGFDVRLLEFLDGPMGGRWASVVVTILWLVAITNALNFLDNMDGIAAGVGLVSGGCFLTAAMLNGQWFVGGTLGVMVGALAGFLVFNRPRASIFMGDGGSLVVGFLLAFLTVRTTYRTGEGDPWHAIFMPLCVLAVPLYDLVTVTAIRLSQGRSPLVGDQQHFTHRLRMRGLSDWQVLGVICGLTGINGLSGIILTQVRGWPAALVGAQVVLTLAVLAFYEHGGAGTRGRT